MTQFLVNRLLAMLVTAVAVSIVAILVIHAVPGNIVQQMLGQLGAGSPEARATLEHFFGIDRPLYVQYWDWLTELSHGSLGQSWNQGTPVTGLLLNAFAVTLELTLLSLAFALVLGSCLGLLASMWRGTLLDVAIQAFNVLGLSLPAFWVGAMALVVASNVAGWGPPLFYSGPFSSPADNFQIMALPVLSLGLFNAAAISQFVRDLVDTVVRHDYVRTAVAKGVAHRRVFFKHVFRNILIPLTSFSGVILVGILGGAVAIESVFNLPGIGRLLLWAIETRDYPVLQGGIFLVAIITLIINLVIDLLYAAIDPRVTYA
ncbi:MAG TPA: ABC transporter permease [Trueperaceae bacterium]